MISFKREAILHAPDFFVYLHCQSSSLFYKCLKHRSEMS